MYSVALRLTNVKCGSVQKLFRLSGDPVMKLSMPTTSHPRAIMDSHRWDPMKPAAPVTRIRIALWTSMPAVGESSPSSAGEDWRTSDRVVFEPEAPHPLRCPQIAAIEDHGSSHDRPQPLEI